MGISPYLQRLGTKPGLYFVRAVPKDLQPRLGKKHWRWKALSFSCNITISNKYHDLVFTRIFGLTYAMDSLAQFFVALVVTFKKRKQNSRKMIFESIENEEIFVHCKLHAHIKDWQKKAVRIQSSLEGFDLPRHHNHHRRSTILGSVASMRSGKI